MIKHILVSAAILALLAAGAFAVYAYHPAMEEVATGTQQAFDDDAVERGRVIAAAGYCASCHTAVGGEPWAGNYPMETDFGTVYSTNITPDPESGIGAWSAQAFKRAMQDGVDREGRHLFPAFPYNHFTLMSDQDVDDVYAYIMSEVAPARSTQKDNELPFPLDQRILQAGWKLLFVDSGRYEKDPQQSDEWNRGAYLVEGVTHCGACHTPRNALGAEIDSEHFDGATIDRWTAPALNGSNAAAIRWTARDFSEYLKHGGTRAHGVAAGPMGPVVHAGLRELPDSDLQAIGTYLAAQNDDIRTGEEPAQIIAASLAKGQPKKSYRQDQGERLYVTACASCHYNSEQIELGRPDLGVNSATRLDQPDNLIHVILDGVGNQEGLPGIVMPGFRSALDDQEVAAIAAYLRRTRTDRTPWPDLGDTVSAIRAH
ncbi:c-type cytochrome [Granulosicoccus sp. 3-233]|uniref:c-type cytochrome n=1 Tax=Granulosicoccus sp. 3-233 TaxID=3417969 RepID=UPI003D34C5EB